MQPVLAGEPLIGEGELPDLAGMDDGEEAPGPPVDDGLVQLPEQSRPDPLLAPLRMEGERHQVGVGATHPGHDGPDQCT